jgi:hypothetical protein
MPCYLCGCSLATKPLNLKDSFTAHSTAKCPSSDKLCDRCAWVIPLRLKYYNPNTKKEGMLFSRNWSWLLSANENHPKIEGDTVSELPTRATIRRWLLDPPEPPFTICIAESGQKHILPWSKKSHSRDYFPVTFELDTVYIDREKLTQDLENYEYLLSLELTKTEINTGQYKSQNLLKLVSNEKFKETEEIISGLRCSRLFELIGYVAVVPIKELSIKDIG